MPLAASANLAAHSEASTALAMDSAPSADFAAAPAAFKAILEALIVSAGSHPQGAPEACRELLDTGSC